MSHTHESFRGSPPNPAQLPGCCGPIVFTRISCRSLNCYPALKAENWRLILWKQETPTRVSAATGLGGRPSGLLQQTAGLSHAPRQQRSARCGGFANPSREIAESRPDSSPASARACGQQAGSVSGACAAMARGHGVRVAGPPCPRPGGRGRAVSQPCPSTSSLDDCTSESLWPLCSW